MSERLREYLSTKASTYRLIPLGSPLDGHVEFSRVIGGEDLSSGDLIGGYRDDDPFVVTEDE